jgi:hypothetical protein
MTADPELVEVACTVREHAGQLSVLLELRRWAAYPPVFSLSVPDATGERLASAETAIDPHLPLLEYLRSPVAAHAPDSIPARAIQDAVDLFFGQLPSLLKMSGPLAPDRLGRVTLDLPPWLAALSWESYFHQPANPEQGAGAATWVLRRVPAPLWQPVRPLELPVRCQVLSPPGRPIGWARDLFDPWTLEQTTAAGAFTLRVGAAWHAGQEPHLLHVPAPFAADTLLQQFRQLGAAPMVIVLHGPDTRGHAERIATAHALLAGADDVRCVVVVSSPAGAPPTLELFRTFHRKLMHNRPIDHALHLAREAVRVATRELLTTSVVARPGGELQLLLTRAVADVLAGRPFVPAPPGPGPEKEFLMGPPLTTLPTMAPGDTSPDWVERGGAFEADPPWAGRSAPTYRASLLARQIDEGLAARFKEAELLLADVAGQHFEEELHAVRSIVSSRARALATRKAIEDGKRLLYAIVEQPAAVEPREARLTQAWFTDGRDQVLAPQAPLIVGEKYGVHVKVSPVRIEQALAAAQFPDDLLAAWFKEAEILLIDVRLFADPGELAVEQGAGELQLPRTGSSDPLRFNIEPRRAGKASLRICLYHRGALLQSLLATTAVVEGGAPVAAAEPRTIALDFVANPALDLLDELPRPALSLFTNHALDGSHWIGVCSAAAAPGSTMSKGALFTFEEQELTERSTELRNLLESIKNRQPYTYALPFPLMDDEARAQCDQDLIELACCSYDRFFNLFATDAAAAPTGETFREAALAPGVVTIARLRRQATTLPWAALYDYHLDVVRRNEMCVCPVFRAQLAGNRWTQPADATYPEDLGAFAQTRDLLDDPAACRAQADCPLNDERRADVTVCPFGFWGFRHEIEQPLFQIEPTPPDQPSEEIKLLASRGPRISRNVGETITLRLGFDPVLKSAGPHARYMTANLPAVVHAEQAWDRPSVLGWLVRGGGDLLYLYCDGVLTAGKDLGFRFGPNPEDLIVTSSLGKAKVWGRPAAVILNACGGVAASPERIDKFVAVLRNLGALGVMGTETTVFDLLARPFARDFLARVLSGVSFGRALLQTRRSLLRLGNPLGLTYTFHGATNLHLHADDACASCAAPGVETSARR